MESDEVMLTVRLTTAERTLLRRLAHGHRGDVSEVVADALLDMLPTLLAHNAPRPTEQPARFAPCAVTVWLPPELAELLPALAAHLTQPPTTPTPCTALATALHLWLRQDPARLAAGLHTLHGGHPHARQHRPYHPHHPHARPAAA
ncbi:hypothetical protein [Kitasatospora cineracea]|uniref:Uncharacterized protein n=1 Tax=Kitasatospora cineracea TaxID=88074 RepID=A0A8G1UL62_9ACTN|nr:hypothetical protein [Kitasatospora cineracea]ROR46060.1 hypothetical protein EDD39_4316 [Kitasatospora cineracea]